MAQNLIRSIKRRLPFIQKKEIPTEYVMEFEESIEELANNPNEPGTARKKPYRVKIIRATRAEEMDLVRTLLQSHELILINIANINDVEEVKRGISKVKVACARLGGEILGLDTKWLLVVSDKIRVEKESAF
ncbi:MAG: hypothetical protein V1820_06280 [archaeon]